MNKYLRQLIDKAEYPLVSDYDGCMFEARWNGDRINIPGMNHDKLVEVLQKGEGGVSEPIPAMVGLFLFASTGYCISCMSCDAEFVIKARQIATYYPTIPPENLFKADSIEDKIRFLEMIEEKHGGFIYIDDHLPALQMYENHFGDNCKFFHISSLFV